MSLITVDYGTVGGSSELVNLGSTVANQKITLGYKPRKLMITEKCQDGNVSTQIYDEDVSTTTMKFYYTNGVSDVALSLAGHEGLYSIDNDGFTMSSYPNTYVQYIAIK